MKDEEKNTCSEQCVEENQEHCQCDCQCEADCMANEEQSINISEIESELDKALASASENRDLYLRTVADLDTYRRKVQREKQELSKFALQPLIEELLPSIDHLDMAIQACTT
ncbi:MAG: nucleotide exchange factor GrpE, partial [Opitutales bacterium]|nr:nucleotide exchange factor GrpE [Opitutales bacterium]